MARLLVELGNRVEDREARACRTLSVVVMRLRVPEVSHDPVAEIFRDVPIEPGYRFGGDAMVARHSLAPFLGIELSGDCRGAHEVAEQHRQVPPLADYLARLGGLCLGD